MAASDERHSPEEIGSYIKRNYPEFANSEVSTVSPFGPNYQVILTDAARARHVVYIDPKNVTADRERATREKTLDPVAARKEAIRVSPQSSLSIPGPKSQDRDVRPAVRERAEQIMAAKRRTQRSAPGKDKDREIER